MQLLAYQSSSVVTDQLCEGEGSLSKAGDEARLGIDMCR